MGEVCDEKIGMGIPGRYVRGVLPGRPPPPLVLTKRCTCGPNWEGVYVKGAAMGDRTRNPPICDGKHNISEGRSCLDGGERSMDGDDILSS